MAPGGKLAALAVHWVGQDQGREEGTLGCTHKAAGLRQLAVTLAPTKLRACHLQQPSACGVAKQAGEHTCRAR